MYVANTGHISQHLQVTAASALTTSITSFIMSTIDYCNVALAGLPQYELDQVQSVVNAAAWLSSSRQMPADTTM